MVGQYVKLNKMTKHHAGYLPNMEELVESLAKCCYKTKMDLRSGFWQIGLTKRAQELAALPIPQLSNDILYIDFVSMDEFNNQDYVLAIVDGLTRFV